MKILFDLKDSKPKVKKVLKYFKKKTGFTGVLFTHTSSGLDLIGYLNGKEYFLENFRYDSETKNAFHNAFAMLVNSRKGTWTVGHVPKNIKGK